MSKVVLEFNPKFIATTVALLLVVAISIYTISVDYNTKYDWYYPLNEDRSIGVYYPKYERTVYVYDLVNNEILKISHQGIGLGGFSISSSRSSYARSEYKGINMYVLAITIVVLFTEAYGYLKVRKLNSTYALTLFIVLTATSILALLAMTYYVNMGVDVGYSWQDRSVSGRLTGPFDARNLTGLEGIKEVSRLLELFRYVYVCPRQSLASNSLVAVTINAPTAFTIPIVRAGGNFTLGYSAASYTSGGEAWCALLSIAEMNATYSMYIVDFQRKPAEDLVPLVSMLPLAFTLMSLSLAIALRTQLRK